VTPKRGPAAGNYSRAHETETGSTTDRIARTRAYHNGQLVAEDFPVAEVSDHWPSGAVSSCARAW
jgi:hypothetical protein